MKRRLLCRELIKRDSFDLVVILFSETHAANHQFWKYRSDSEGTSSPADLANAIRDVYEMVDRQFGLLLEQLPEASNVFVISSVGMEDSYPTNGIVEDLFRKLGYQKPRASGKGYLRPIDFIRRAIPEPWRVAISHGT